VPTKASGTKGKKKDSDPQFAIIKTELVPLADLRMYYKNPRVGNVNEVAKSLHVNSQFKPVVVNVGTHTGRDNEILAGNHTFKAAGKELQWVEDGETYEKPTWTHIWASFVDVDEDAAKRIVLADNATADKGEYDEKLRAELLLDLPNVSGTGYTLDEFEDIKADFGDFGDDIDLSEDGEDLESMMDDEDYEEQPKGKRFADTELGDEIDAEEDESPISNRERLKIKEETGIDIAKQSEELGGVLQLDDSPFFDYVKVGTGELQFQLPRYLPEMLVQTSDLPEKWSAWAGSATRDKPENEDPDHWWLYNYGVDSTSGMEHVANSFVSFFTFDEYFERWWDAPSKYVAKLINSKVKYAVTPDFSSVSEMGNTFCLWQIYRQMYLGRYFQEAGIKLLPHVIWPDGDMEFLENITLAALPDEVPVLMLQLQTIDEKNVAGGIQHFKDQVQKIIKTVNPETLVVYAGKPGLEFVQSLNLHGSDLRWLNTRQAALSESMKGRTKKTGL